MAKKEISSSSEIIEIYPDYFSFKSVAKIIDINKTLFTSSFTDGSEDTHELVITCLAKNIFEDFQFECRLGFAEEDACTEDFYTYLDWKAHDKALLVSSISYALLTEGLILYEPFITLIDNLKFGDL